MRAVSRGRRSALGGHRTGRNGPLNRDIRGRRVRRWGCRGGGPAEPTRPRQQPLRRLQSTRSRRCENRRPLMFRIRGPPVAAVAAFGRLAYQTPQNGSAASRSGARSPTFDARSSGSGYPRDRSGACRSAPLDALDHEEPRDARPGRAAAREQATTNGGRAGDQDWERPTSPTSAARSRPSVNRVLLGKPEVVRLSVIALLTGGHLLIEDVPGVGKTRLAKALARTVDATVNRVQFTPDLMPSDVTGVSVYDRQSGLFEFRPGPGLREHPGGRRDQPRVAEDPVGPAGGDGGAAGHRRRHHLSRCSSRSW